MDIFTCFQQRCIQGIFVKMMMTDEKYFFFSKNFVEWAHFDPALSSCKQCSTCFECSNLSLSFTTHYFTKNISSDSYELRIWNKLSQNQLFHTFVKKLISLLLAHAINVEDGVTSIYYKNHNALKAAVIWIQGVPH